MLYSEIIQRLRKVMREALGGLPAPERRAAIRRAGLADTHVYAWLRGNDGSLSPQAVDALMEAAGLVYRFDLRGSRGGFLFAPDRIIAGHAGRMGGDIDEALAMVRAAPHGTQSDLARAIGANPDQVNRWAHGYTRPRGRYASKIVEWVEQNLEWE